MDTSTVNTGHQLVNAPRMWTICQKLAVRAATHVKVGASPVNKD